MINDVYNGYGKAENIPYEMLLNASQCCEIYVEDKHLNHEIGARCKLINEELERRQMEAKR